MSVLGEWAPYAMLILVGFLPNEVWRMLGVVLARNPHYRFVIASLDEGPKDLDSHLEDSELDELEEAGEARR